MPSFQGVDPCEPYSSYQTLPSFLLSLYTRQLRVGGLDQDHNG